LLRGCAVGSGPGGRAGDPHAARTEHRRPDAVTGHARFGVRGRLDDDRRPSAGRWLPRRGPRRGDARLRADRVGGAAGQEPRRTRVMLWGVATTEVLLLLGTVGMTLGVSGVFALRDTYARLHSASNAMLMGVFTMLLAALVAGPSDVVARAVLVGV